MNNKEIESVVEWREVPGKVGLTLNALNKYTFIVTRLTPEERNGVRLLIEDTIAAVKEIERNAVVEKIKSHRFQTYEANTGLFQGNELLSTVKTERNLIKMEDLDAFIDSLTDKSDKTSGL
jgi:hypothetical protein